MIRENIRFWALNYFAHHACPDRFSLTSESAKKNNFYEVRVYFPQGSKKELEKLHKSAVGAQKVLYHFIPSKGRQHRKGLIQGKKFSPHEVVEDCYVSAGSLKFVRIDVTYYLRTWRAEETHCSDLMLVKMVLWRALGLMQLDILYSKVARKIRLWRVNKRLRTPLKSKFEIYECLMSNESFLRTGNFRKSEITKHFLGGSHTGDFNLNRKMSQSLNWILDASIEDGEIVRIGHENDHDPLFKMKGKGIHYFTLTKEQIKNEEHNKQIQKAQVKIQNRMLLLTVLLVIATFITAIDKFDDAFGIVQQFLNWVEEIYNSIKTT
ncbi:hypothetical protein [Vibrio fluvialis]|uniref:hypothetical protein n=1 Tax=Vibrio fluvialis TaxID=676 RepID=UPI001F549817|nr:hypothetical protein [Vibrio fluvialis]